MLTSFRRKNSELFKEEVEESNKKVSYEEVKPKLPKGVLADTYMTIYDAVEERVEADLALDSGDLSMQVEDEDVVEKKKGFRFDVFAVVAVLVALLLGGSVFIYSLFFSKGNTLEGVSAKIDSFYTSEDKVDILGNVSSNDLNNIYLDLNELAKDGDNTKSLEEEVGTISKFMTDKKELEGYSLNSYDLSTVGLVDSIETIKSGTSSYSVSGLAVTITNMANEILDDYNEFISLRSELQGIVDVETFDAESYRAKINEVTHTANNEELIAMYNNLVASKAKLEAEQKLKEAATKEAQELAEKQLEEAKRVQQETQKKLDEAQSRLAETATDILNKAKDFLSNDGTDETTQDDYSEELEEEVLEESDLEVEP